MKILIFCLLIFGSSCSFINYANKFSKNEKSNWIIDSHGSCTSYSYYFRNNLINFNFCNSGKTILYGPPYLPVIPEFGNSFVDKTMDYRFIVKSKDSLIMSNKIKVIINSKDELILDIDTELNEMPDNYFHSYQSFYIEKELDSINTLDIYIDSIRVKDKAFYIEPLKLKMGKKLIHKFIVN